MTRRLRLLLLSYYFPPAGGPAVQRPEMLLRHLPAEVSATVITAAVEDYQAFTPLGMPLDSTRSCAESDVFRLPARCPYRLFRLLPKLCLTGAIRWCYAPDVARNWARGVTRLAEVLHAQEPFDVVFSTAPPFSAALAGRDCARRLRVPWVCDFRDLWTGYLLGAWPTRFHYLREVALERSAMAEATTLVMVTPGSRQWMLRAHPVLTPDRVHSVTNGYASSDFPSQSKTPGERFVIVHTGVFCGPPGAESAVRRFARGRGFQPRRADRRAHSPSALIGAMELLGDPRVEFRHLGPMDGESHRLFRNSKVRDQIMVAGYREHRAALAELASADAAYLCLATSLDEERNELVPQKTYEYLGARKPVLAPIQEGDARDFLLQAGTGICTPPNDAPALARALQPLIEAKFSGRPLVVPRQEFIRRFEWSRLAGELFGLLDRAASSRYRASVPETVT